MNEKIAYEFLLWDNCNNNCRFCFQRQNDKRLSLEERKLSLERVLAYLKLDFERGNDLILMGGEIFDTPSLFENLNIFFDSIIDMMLTGNINILRINTNLIYKKKDALYYLLDAINQNNLFDRFTLTTSFDVEGRFIGKTKDLMLSNLKEITKKYPCLYVTVNSILTNSLCNSILNKSFDIKSFQKEYGVEVLLIPYIILKNDLVASREKIFKTLRLVNDEIPNYISNMILRWGDNVNFERRIFRFNGKEYEYCTSENSECGHSVNFKNYSTHGTCLICDLKTLFGI